MRIRTMTLAALGVLALSGPASAQQLNLPPDVLGALTELYQTASYLCQSGAPVGCQTAMAIDQQAMSMSNALTYCQQGDQQACAFYQQSVMAVSNAYQTTYGGGMAGGGVQAYDPTPQHMQNMQTLQNQFNAGQQRYQQQQQSNDRMFQTYMDSLRN